jgi:hypothetical protein
MTRWDQGCSECVSGCGAAGSRMMTAEATRRGGRGAVLAIDSSQRARMAIIESRPGRDSDVIRT